MARGCVCETPECYPMMTGGCALLFGLGRGSCVQMPGCISHRFATPYSSRWHTWLGVAYTDITPPSQAHHRKPSDAANRRPRYARYRDARRRLPPPPDSWTPTSGLVGGIRNAGRPWRGPHAPPASAAMRVRTAGCISVPRQGARICVGRLAAGVRGVRVNGTRVREPSHRAPQ